MRNTASKVRFFKVRKKKMPERPSCIPSGNSQKDQNGLYRAWKVRRIRHISGKFRGGIAPSYYELRQVLDPQLIPYVDYMIIVTGTEKRRKMGERSITHPYESALRPYVNGWEPHIRPRTTALTLVHDTGEEGAGDFYQSRLLNEAFRYIFDSDVFVRREHSFELARSLDSLTFYELSLIKNLVSGGKSKTDVISTLHQNPVASLEAFKRSTFPFLDGLLEKFKHYFSRPEHEDVCDMTCGLNEFAAIVRNSMPFVREESPQMEMDFLQSPFQREYGTNLAGDILRDRNSAVNAIARYLSGLDMGYLPTLQEAYGDEEHSIDEEVQLLVYESMYTPRSHLSSRNAVLNGEPEPAKEIETKLLDTIDAVRIPVTYTPHEAYKVTRKSDAKIKAAIHLLREFPDSESMANTARLVRITIDELLSFLQDQCETAARKADDRLKYPAAHFHALYEAFQRRYEGLSLSPLPENLRIFFPNADASPNQR